MHPGDDGCLPVLNHLATKYELVARNATRIVGPGKRNIAGRIARDAREKIAETLVVEGDFPFTSSQIVAKLGIAPQKVTHVLALVDARAFETDRFGQHFRDFAEKNGITGIAIGNIHLFDSQSYAASDVEHLGPDARSLLQYVESYLTKPVPYLATSPETVIDREPTPLHEVEDKATITRVFANGVVEFPNVSHGTIVDEITGQSVEYVDESSRLTAEDWKKLEDRVVERTIDTLAEAADDVFSTERKA
jgi:hypothetical protein